ncbi:protein of unknown function [Denitratisoma oestradiolicum]|uniref:Uncharacterized protein n=1 Tax=Denitratisoma oestradiolicum TaxID=311182 RepID=A0A6S6XXR4_9PROT|nr:protein of unknown function [Denitratisoma oestradiolicum]
MLDLLNDFSSRISNQLFNEPLGLVIFDR